MKKHLFRTAVGLLGLLAAGLGLAAAPADVASLLRDSPTLQDYPDAAALVLFNDKTVTWQGSDRLLEQHHTLTKILQVRGWQRYQEYNLLHWRPAQETRVSRAGVYRDAATFVPVEATAVRDLPAADAPWTGLYGGLARKSFTYPAAALNSCLEVQSERSTTSGVAGVSGIEFFQADAPILERRFQLILPRATALRHRVLGPLTIDLVRSDGPEGTGYVFFTGRSPQLKAEPSSPPFAQQAGRLVYSTYEDWSAAAGPLRQIFTERPGARVKTAALTRKLGDGAATGREKLQRIHQYLSRQMRSVELGLHLGGYRPHAPDEVLDAGYGDRLDKAVLAAAMLDEAGLAYVPVLLNSQYAELAEDVPALEQFDALLLRVALPGAPAVYLDPFTELDDLGACPYLPGNRGLVMAVDGTRLESLAPEETVPSVAENTLSLDLAADGAARLTVGARLVGMFASAARYYLRDKPPEETTAIFTAAAATLSLRARPNRQAVVDLDAPDRPVQLELGLELPDLASRQGDYLVVALPDFPFALAVNRLFLGPEKRTSALWLGAPAQSRTRFEVRLPAGFEAVYVPPAALAENDCWAARKSSRWDSARGLVVVEEEVRLKKSTLPAADYPSARSFYAGMTDRAHRFLILRRAAP